ncbi:hypothetical protein V5799_013413 [Amblyomma americanum]|uniref:Uncharacterized protein n=1 Tax=Amblyomma americanum TaxID=6943 RepID=A0AAQ4E5Z2_AMBAM
MLRIDQGLDKGTIKFRRNDRSEPDVLRSIAAWGRRHLLYRVSVYTAGPFGDALLLASSGLRSATLARNAPNGNISGLANLCQGLLAVCAVDIIWTTSCPSIANRGWCSTGATKHHLSLPSPTTRPSVQDNCSSEDFMGLMLLLTA